HADRVRVERAQGRDVHALPGAADIGRHADGRGCAPVSEEDPSRRVELPVAAPGAGVVEGHDQVGGGDGMQPGLDRGPGGQEAGGGRRGGRGGGSGGRRGGGRDGRRGRQRGGRGRGRPGAGGRRAGGREGGGRRGRGRGRRR